MCAVKAIDMEYSFYPLGEDLGIKPDPSKGEALLVIHYFGWISQTIESIRRANGKSYFLIEDASQALLSDWKNIIDGSSYIILSQRKFAPLPLGGWCNISGKVKGPDPDLEILFWRSFSARMLRGLYLMSPNDQIDSEIEAFYLKSFLSIENFLDNNPQVSGLPQMAIDLFYRMNWDAIANRRRENWLCLFDLLANHIEPLHSYLPDDVVPLGFVVRFSQRDRLRKYLADKRIFCPIHWELPPEVDPSTFPEAAKLSQTLLTLPIDQRYNSSDMEYLASVLKKVL